MTAVASDAPITPRELADAVYRLLTELDPALFRLEAAESIRANLHSIRARADGLVASYRTTPPNAVQARLWEAVRTLVAALPDPYALTDRAAFVALYEAVYPLYQQLADALAAANRSTRLWLGGVAAELRPHNATRSLVHICLGLSLALAYETILTPKTALIAAAVWCCWAWTLEIARRISPVINDWCMWFFGPIAREQERKRVNSSTWFGTGILISAALYPPVPAVLGLIAAAVGDPVAGYIGRRYGRTKLYLGRSLEGSVAFAVVTFAVGLAWTSVFHPAVGYGALALVAAGAALGGAAVEHLSNRVDDNLAVTVLSGASAAVVYAML